METVRPPPVRDRAAHYLAQAEKFRQMAEAEPVTEIREQLRALAEQYQSLAERLLQPDRA